MACMMLWYPENPGASIERGVVNYLGCTGALHLSFRGLYLGS